MKSTETVLYLHSIIFPVTTLGPGRRIGIWVEGCTLNCPACTTPQLFKKHEKHAVKIHLLIEMLKPLLEKSNRLTISGGEPFQQPEALLDLVSSLRTRFDPEIMVYSGYTLDEIKTISACARKILQQIDILIDGRYRADQPNTKLWRGSDNQRICLLSKRARSYGDLDAATNHHKRALQIEYSQRFGLRFIGIPERSFKSDIRNRLSAKGLVVHC